MDNTFAKLFYLTILGSISSAGVPRSPCPTVFQYGNKNNEWHGQIKAPLPSPNVYIRLDVKMTIPTILPTKYSGRIEMVDWNNILSLLLSGGPIKYKVYFPLQQLLPTITSLSINGEVFCTGPPVTGLVVTTITLQHTLYLNHTQNFSPKFSQTPLVKTPENNDSPKEGREIVQHFDPVSTTSFPFLPTINFRPQPSDEMPLTDTDTKETYNDICGTVVNPHPLVVKGGNVNVGSFPWLAAIFIQNSLGLEYHCSGSLFTNRHVVTAAHCIKYGDSKAKTPDEIVVALGKHNIRDWAESGSQIVKAEQIVIHPDYKSLNSDADLAVIILAENVKFSATIRPICLWSEAEDSKAIVGKRGVVVGWGKDETGLAVTPTPRQTELPIVSQEECLRSKLDFNYITSNRTLCAGKRDGTGPCNGDSGSGLLLKRGKWMIRGVVSKSLKDKDTNSCDLRNYVVFTDVAKFNWWLRQFLF